MARNTVVDIKVPEIVNRLKQMLGMQEGPALRDLEMPLVVNLTLDVKDLLADIIYGYKGGVDLSGAGGADLVFHTVPDDERWEVIGWVISLVVGASSCFVMDKEGNQIYHLYTGTAKSDVNQQSFFIEPGWTITRRETNNGADSSESLQITYRRWKFKH